MTRGEGDKFVPVALSRTPKWFGDGILIVLVIAAAYFPMPADEYAPTSVIGLALAVAPIVVIPLRHRWPLTALVTCMIIFLVLASQAEMALGVILASAAAMYSVSTRRSRAVAFYTALCAISILLLASFFAVSASGIDLRAFLPALVVAFGAATGDAVRSRRAYIRAITQRAERAERTREAEAQRRVSEERLRIARDLHDTVAHQISVISLNAGLASSSINTQPDQAREALLVVRGAARNVLGEISGLLSMLRADDSGPQGPHPQYDLASIESLIEQFETDGFAVKSTISISAESIPTVVSIAGYRIIQEALTNADKHGEGGAAHMLLQSKNEVLEIIVTNRYLHAQSSLDANEINMNKRVSASNSLGIIGMRERATAVGGTLDVGTDPLSGRWRVHAVLPLQQKEE